jgi:hypothetical protein
MREVFTMAKPLRSLTSLSRRVFLAQDGPRKIKKYGQNRLEMSFLNMFFKFCTMSVAETAMKNDSVGVVKGSPEFPQH